MNFMNIPAIKNQQQTLIKRNFDKIYAHEAAHKRAAGYRRRPWVSGIYKKPDS